MARGTVNKVILMGRLGDNAELKYTPNGTAVANFNLATNEVWKDQSGNQQEKTDWHRVTCWRKLAEFAGEWLKKGSYIYLEGKLETRSWDDKDGNKRYMTEVVADSIQFVGSKKDNSEKPNNPASQEEREPEPTDDGLPF